MKNTNTYIRNSIGTYTNRKVSIDKIRNSMTEMIFDNWNDDASTDGILIVEAIDRVFIKWPRAQQKKNTGSTMTGIGLSLSYIITTEAPMLPIPNGMYRGRRKDGTFTIIAYYDSIMVDIGCGYRNDIKIIDPFWIDLRTLKYKEYKSPEQLAYEEAKDKESQRSKLIAENIKLRNEKAVLEATITELNAALERSNEKTTNTNTDTDTDEDPFI